MDVDRLVGLRAHFAAIGDIGLCREIDAQLARLGAPPIPDEKPRMERAVNPKVPAKRRK